jgi:hypothetical protein
MPTDYIVTLLIAEREKLSRAIEVLQGARRRGRPRKNLLALMTNGTTAPETTQKRTRTFTAAQRKAQAARMKKYWAAKKKGAR